MQPNIDKKKRTSTSGSRSKSKKSANNIKPDQTVQLKPKPLHIFHNQDICAKIKTQNSVSLNKSKGSRKNSKSLKRPQKGSIKESKDQSYLVSAQRKYSVNKINKTQATHLQSEDIYKKLYIIKKQLGKLEVPTNFSISQIEEYYNQIKQSFINISLQPLESIFLKLHSMYIVPIQNFFDMIRPYQSILIKKQQISKMIKQQIQENQKLYEQLDPEDIQIIKLKQKIQKNADLIEEMKRKKKLENNQFSMKKKKNPLNNIHSTKTNDLSKQNNSPVDKMHSQQFERKLVKQYEKVPFFHQEKRGNSTKIADSQIKKVNTFSDALKSHYQQEPNIIEPNNLKIDTKELQQSEQQEHSQKESIKDLGDEYLEDEGQQGKQAKFEQGISKMGIKSGGLSFNFKLDLPKLDKSNVGFHDEFYSKLDEFSQSWRNQALRQKRF